MISNPRLRSDQVSLQPAWRQEGFSLLEVLVAFAVLSLVLGTLFQVFSRGLLTADLSRHYAGALQRAESLLAAAGVETPLEEGQQNGEFDDKTYRWTLTVTPYSWEDPSPPETLPVKPYQITVEVGWEQDGRARSVTLTTLRLVSRNP